MRTPILFLFATTTLAQSQSLAIYPLEGATPAAVATDKQGSFYIVGTTSSTQFPVTANALQPTLHGSSDAFISGFSPSGGLTWSTYFGGSGGDSAVGVAIDSAGNILVAGNTASPDLPVLNAYQSTLPGNSTAFLLKLSPAGKILYSTYLGTALTATALAVDGAGAAYVAGSAPTAITGYGTEGVVTKLSASGALVYSYQSAESFAAFRAIAVDTSGSAYVAGTIDSGPYFDKLLVLKLSPDGSTVAYENHLGGSQYNYGTAITVDATGAAYVAGGTTSVDFPLVSPVQATLGARPLWVSTDGGSTWTPIDDLPFAAPRTLVADSKSPRTLYAGASDTGIFQSTDGGQTFTSLNNGIANPGVSSLALDPSNPANLYATAVLGQIYGSANRGAAWSILDYVDQEPTEIAVDPQKPSTLYVVGPKAVKSTDGGNTWNPLTEPAFGVSQLLVDPVTEGTLYGYTGGGEVGGVHLLPTVARSTNGGATWSTLPVNAAQPGLVADPSTNPATIYAGTAARSIDGGNTWTPLAPTPGIIPASATAMAVDPRAGTVYVAGTPAIGPLSLDVSTNQGQSWTQLSVPSQIPGITGMTSTPGALYAWNDTSQYSTFVLKLSPDGSTILYSTYLRGHNDRGGGAGPALALDGAGNMVVAGNTASSDFPTVNAAQSAMSGISDAFLTVLSPDGQEIDYSTYLGGAQITEAAAVAVDPSGNLIVAGLTDSPSILGTAIPLDTAGTSTQYSGFVAKVGVSAPVPTPAITKVVSAASFQIPIEAGSWVMIQGTNLANDRRVWQASDFNGNNLPTALDGASVTIDGIRAYVEYISPTQINVLAPADSATGPVNVVVTNNGHASAPVTAQLQSVAPALFMTPQDNAIASVLPGYVPVTANALAMPGDLVVLWATGFGPTTPPTPAGAIVVGAPATATLPVVTVGGMQVPVVSSVMTTGNVGLYQITIQLPANVLTGTPVVQASIGGAQTQSGVTLLVGAQ